MTSPLKRTPLYRTHTGLGARMVPFAGWEMPVQYRSILAESRAVRSAAGSFDVSHMGRLYISGPDSPGLLDWVVTADAASLRVGRARYGLICNDVGGIIDDTVFYRRAEDSYLLVCNAGNREQVISWFRTWVGQGYPDVRIDDATEETAMIAIQGPSAAGDLERVSGVETSGMRPFSYSETEVDGAHVFVGRTGYTGEDGFELVVGASDAPRIWDALASQGSVPCGLGARDVLRLEAGLALHGNDIDPTTTPLEAGLGRFVRLEKEFVGVDVLRRQSQGGPRRRLIGMVLEGRSIARAGYDILTQDSPVGLVTSGTLSPALDRSIAMGYVGSDFASPGQMLTVDIRGRRAEAQVVPLPFYSRKAAP